MLQRRRRPGTQARLSVSPRHVVCYVLANASASFFVPQSFVLERLSMQKTVGGAIP
jgi:hypothetical protein